MTDYAPPFPWFGGKRRIAPVIWRALGDVDNYVEPFAGGMATLFCRPKNHLRKVETVNDFDMYLANFWRALKSDPEGVAYYANNPVNEADLTARHIWLVNSGRERIARLQGDPDYYDAQVAGWWVWGICSWIGSSWCSGSGPWRQDADGRLTNNAEGQGVIRQRPHLGNAGQGVNRKRPHLGGSGGNGMGVNRLRGAGEGADTGLAELVEYMQGLAERLRYVRVCCGDWSRVVARGALSQGATVGVFLDPPYDVDMRDGGIYNTDSHNGHISADVRAWCLSNGDNPRYRIVLAGYEGEHDMPASWRIHAWSAGAAYARAEGGSANETNRHKERLWLSPHCLGAERQRALFAMTEATHDQTNVID